MDNMIPELKFYTNYLGYRFHNHIVFYIIVVTFQITSNNK
jgi:hypothetical protein